MPNSLYQRGTIIFAYEGTNEQLDSLVETNECITVNYWECNGQIAIIILWCFVAWVTVPSWSWR